jgi:aminoglycoside phosphotransferase family enzyme/predicted kinase
MRRVILGAKEGRTMTRADSAPDETVAVAETHSAVVFFVGDRAYKLKKPVDLGFLDFRTREAREADCHHEVELNRRLSPDVYLGVADVHGPDGTVCDHLVVMRRMPQDRRLSSLVARGVPVDDELWDLAHLLAAFHSRAEHSPAADLAAGVEALAGRWADNTAVLREHAGRFVEGDDVERAQTLADRYLAGRRPLFDARTADGRAVDGHGDLMADDIFCLDDGPRVLDCIEFAEAFRLGDTLADAAFLAMDLERLGHPELASRFLAAYREHAGDSWPVSLAHHHIAYRAHVRAKVAAIRTAQGVKAAGDEARNLLALALRHLDAARVRLIVVGGLPGTGKSTLAAGLGDRLGATVLRSDEIRKELAGLAPTTPADAPFGEGIYTPAGTERTYDTLLDRATVALGLGESVVLDASWTHEPWRAAARAIAERTRSELVELRCSAPTAVAAKRMHRRQAAHNDPSDATPAIAATMAASMPPWPTATTIDTSGAPDTSLSCAVRALADVPA